jgi:hypothetical protein
MHGNLMVSVTNMALIMLLVVQLQLTDSQAYPLDYCKYLMLFFIFHTELSTDCIASYLLKQHALQVYVGKCAPARCSTRSQHWSCANLTESSAHAY